MVYKRVKRPPLNIREFARTPTTTDDDLVKVCLADGGELFFTFKSTPNMVSDPRWRLDKQLLPQNLIALLQKHNLEEESEFILSDGSGTVGRALRLDVEPTTHWQVTMRFTSESQIKSIRPVRRPRKPNVFILSGDMNIDRSSDYH